MNRDGYRDQIVTCDVGVSLYIVVAALHERYMYVVISVYGMYIYMYVTYTHLYRPVVLQLPTCMYTMCIYTLYKYMYMYTYMA